jgi:hypothetical protein
MLVVEDFMSPAGASRESAISGKQIISPLNGQIEKVNLTMESIVYQDALKSEVNVPIEAEKDLTNNLLSKSQSTKILVSNK